MAVYKEKKSDKWIVDISHEGVRRRLTSPENSRKGAKAYETDVRQRLARGADLASLGRKVERIAEKEERESRRTFDEFAQEWLRTHVQTNNKRSTIKTTEGILRNHLIPFFGKYRVDVISSRHIEEYKSSKANSAKTINNQLGVLGKALTCAFEWGYIPARPRVKLLKAQQPVMDFLTNGEEKRLLEDDDEAVWNVMCFLASSTGMRIGEILALHWGDIDFETSTICIRYSKSGTAIEATKTHKARYTFLTPLLHSKLWEWRTMCNGKNKDLVFVNPNTGRSYSRSSASKALERMCKRVGIRKIGWHTLRHTFATRLAAKGTPLLDLQALLGHKSLKMVQRYAHVTPERLRRAIMSLDHELIDFRQYVGSKENETVKIRRLETEFYE